MPRYTFTFKKDDIFVEFFTADKDVVERQFQIWVSDADDYVNNRPRRSAYELAPDPIQEEQQENIEQQAEPVKVEEAKQEQPIEIQEPIIEQKVEESVEQAVIQEEPSVEQISIEPVEEPSFTVNEPEVYDKASTLLRTINTIQGDAENLVKAPEVEQPSSNFEQILDESIENPTFEPSKPRDQIFLNLVTSKRTTDKFNYLMITAYYLSEFEKLERFSLKQINAKLMQNLSEVIDHASLQEAINRGLIELVPDLTGVSEVAEYRLTREGEEFFAKI